MNFVSMWINCPWWFNRLANCWIKLEWFGNKCRSNPLIFTRDIKYFPSFSRLFSCRNAPMIVHCSYSSAVARRQEISHLSNTEISNLFLQISLRKSNLDDLWVNNLLIDHDHVGELIQIKIDLIIHSKWIEEDEGQEEEEEILGNNRVMKWYF